MEILNATVKNIENFRMAVDNGKHSICLDLSSNVGGEDKGPSSLDLTVMSLAGCIAQIFTLVSKKMRIEISDLTVKMRAEKPDDAPTITRTECELSLKSKEKKEKIERAWKHTMSTCPVGQLFEAAGIDVKCKLSIEK